MKELELKYGCNPNQKPARVFTEQGELPLAVLSGRPGYINLLDALNSWQLVRELKRACGLPAAASFKHVSPAGAALGLPLGATLAQSCFAADLPGLNDSPLACAYARARGADRMSSFGDWIALSDPCDETTARLIQREVSDGVIAPGYDAAALELLRQKRKGAYNVVQIDPAWEAPALERKQVFGVTFEQAHNTAEITPALLTDIVSRNRTLPETAVCDLIVALITLKYTQSNSVCYTLDGQTTGVGAGQQSRIHCTRLAGNKSDLFLLRQHQKVLELPFLPELGRPDRSNVIDLYLTEPESVLAESCWPQYFRCRPEALSEAERRDWLATHTGLSLGSDAFFPFSDNVERAFRSGVRYIAQPCGSIRDDAVIEACDAHDMVMARTGLRLFHH